MFITQMIAHFDSSYIVIRSDIVCALTLGTLDDNGDACFFALGYNAVDLFFEIKAAAEYNYAVKIVEIGKPENIQFSGFVG